jgi:hypothetical protein
MKPELQLASPLFVVPSTWSNDERGNYFEQFIAALLAQLDWECQVRVRHLGMEIDVFAIDKMTNERALVQCKFQKDNISANVIDLLYGQGSRRADIKKMLLFSIADLGKDAKAVLKDIADNGQKPLIYHGPARVVELVSKIDNVAPRRYQAAVGRHIASTSLLIHPGLPRVWLHEEHIQGAAARVVVEPGDSVSDVERALKQEGRFQELPFEAAGHLQEARNSATGISTTDVPSDAVATIPVADSVNDYRPCRPADFVGRRLLVSNIRRFLVAVRQDSTSLRNLAIVGQSGLGKSSLVLKLIEGLHSDRRKKVHSFAVDTRSARGKGFVASAMRAALADAMRADFLQIAEVPDIPTEGPILASTGVRSALKQLESTGKLLVLYFDQFEEVLSKDELRAAFDAMRQLAVEAHAERTALVIGFSWRLGITLSEDNPAYHLWQGLSDSRKTFEIGPFTEGDTNAVLDQFESEFKIPLLRPLRKRLREQSQDLPWLTKKLIIHVYTQIGIGVTQPALLSQRLNAQTLFESDLSDLPNAYVECLKYVAQRSPADVTQVANEFGTNVVSALVGRRLLVRTGGRVAPYWDIFRDFLRDGKVSAIEWQWKPIASPSMALPVFSLIQSAGGLDLATLAVQSGYSEGTAQNVLSDLINLALVQRSEATSRYEPVMRQRHGILAVAEHVSMQLREHAVVRKLTSKVAQGGAMSIDAFKAIVAEQLPGRATKTVDLYYNNFLAWLVFAGVLEVRGARLVRPIGKSAQLGVVRTTRRERSIGFTASAEPADVVAVAWNLSRRRMLRSELRRNVLRDVLSLQLAFVDGDQIIAHRMIRNGMSKSTIAIAVIQAALETPFMLAHRSVARQKTSVLQEGQALADIFGREWTQASAVRYAGAARRWTRYAAKLRP